MSNKLYLLGASTSTYILISILAILIVCLAIFIGLVPVGVWFRTIVSKCYVSPMKLASLKMHRVDVSKIIDSYIKLRSAGIKVDLSKIESHYIAGGDIAKVAEALIMANNSKVELSFETAVALDLANEDVLDIVKNHIKPTIVSLKAVHAVAGDGIELILGARVTLNVDLNKLVKSSNEDGIVSKISEAIVSIVGSTAKHTDILKNPTYLVEEISKKEIDKPYAYKIANIELADMKVGRNVGAMLEAEKAEADKQIARAKAEERKSIAIATEHEMRAKTQEKRAKLLDAEAEVPKALTTAFRAGKIGVMEFYKMKDVLSTSKKNIEDGEN